MARQRYINTKFWDDSYIIDLDPIEKLMYIYFLTNPLTSICGCYEIAIKRIAFDTGIDKDMVIKILNRFEADNKMKYDNGWIAIKNFIKHQKVSENDKDKINIGIRKELANIPKAMLKWIRSPLKPLRSPLNYVNVNVNVNGNVKASAQGVDCINKEREKARVKAVKTPNYKQLERTINKIGK